MYGSITNQVIGPYVTPPPPPRLVPEGYPPSPDHLCCLILSTPFRPSCTPYHVLVNASLPHTPLPYPNASPSRRALRPLTHTLSSDSVSPAPLKLGYSLPPLWVPVSPLPPPPLHSRDYPSHRAPPIRWCSLSPFLPGYPVPLGRSLGMPFNSSVW